MIIVGLAIISSIHYANVNLVNAVGAAATEVDSARRVETRRDDVSIVTYSSNTEI